MPPFCEKHQVYHILNKSRSPRSWSYTVCPDCERGLPPVPAPTPSAVESQSAAVARETGA